MSIKDIVQFYEKYISKKNLVYVIVGNSLKISASKLSSFGDVIRVQKRDFYR
jgi:predicted Zn-dependent peptidase